MNNRVSKSASSHLDPVQLAAHQLHQTIKQARQHQGAGALNPKQDFFYRQQTFAVWQPTLGNGLNEIG
ncbi:MAG: hypothetical protein KC475_08020 [Cyanobacteria bacterium HKST-UBA03]|nr:hypothetical protein [Cyanobacteria bacterium HKST-UBA03]